jgi:ribonuclease HII
VEDLDPSFRPHGEFLLAGVDEAGRGPWAGPVTAAAVILPPGAALPGLDDSKKLTPLQRDRLFDLIRNRALAFAVESVDSTEIDRLNILQATFLAMRRALGKLAPAPHLVLVDGSLGIPGLPLPQRPLVGGDGKSASVAAASVLAKVTRDRLMQESHTLYPVYGFDRHKGYGAPVHAEALRRHGPCPLHRRSFAPVKETLRTFPKGTSGDRRPETELC